ncbi:MAG: type II toxin-antitoxin system HicB family antitoxin [Gammaproteobacteria bacterium]|nr:type II toxin-antitoxin system HicB family antitoxin [Gammaproteobacteria bacterium]
MKHTAVIKASEDGYSIACPALPGCWSQGETEEEAIANIIDAIQDYQAAAMAAFIKDSQNAAPVQSISS